jgi:diguanylate cyclase (GGDEF)-like protein
MRRRQHSADQDRMSSRRRNIQRVRLALLGTFLLVYFSWLAFRWIPLENRLVGSLFFVPLNAAAVLAAWGASRRCAPVRRLRQAWRLIALALAGYLAGAIVAMFYEVVLREKSYPSLADPLYLTFFPLMLAGILRFPAERRTRLRSLELALDGLTVAIGGAAVIFYVVLGPSAIEAAGTPLQTAVSAAYPIGDMVLMAGLAAVLLRDSLPISRVPLLLMAPALGLFVVADLIYGYVVLHSGYTTGDPVDVAYAGAIALFLCAAASQRRVDSEPSAAPSAPRRRPTWLPYLAVLVGFGALFASRWHEGFSSAHILGLIVATLAGLVMARQYVSQRQLIRVQRLLQSAHDEMSLLATTDSLTGLANHRGLNSAIEAALAGSRRHGRPLAVLFIDVDHFKHLNDTTGHTSGDAALVEFGQVVQRCLRDSDVLARWGGEEFVVVLPETSAAGAVETAQRVCGAVAEHSFDAPVLTRLTCSIGIANYPHDGDTGSSLIDTADRAMYIAKRLGRNRVVQLSEVAVHGYRDSSTGGRSRPTIRNGQVASGDPSERANEPS